MNPGRIAAIGWSALALTGALGCGAGGDTAADPSAKEIARIGSSAVTRGQFDAWLVRTLGGAAEASAAAPDLKSRLLDQYLDEELLVAAAQEKGIKVTDEEAAALPAEEKVGGDAEAIRRYHLQRKFKEEVILKGVSVDPGEVRAYFDGHLEEYRRPARVVLRQILVDTEAEAKRIHAELVARRDKFEEIAETRSLAPDGGKPTGIEEAILPEAIRAALASMKEGELSSVVADPQGYFILVLEQRQPEQEPSFEAARESIELRLLQERSQEKYHEFVAAMRQRMRLHVNEEALGFPYVKRNGS